MAFSPHELPEYRYDETPEASFETDEYFTLLRNTAILAALEFDNHTGIYPEQLALVISVTPFDKRPITAAELISSRSPHTALKLGLPIHRDPIPVRTIFELSTDEAIKAATANIEPTDERYTVTMGGVPRPITGRYLQRHLEHQTMIGLSYLSEFRFQVAVLEEVLSAGKIDHVIEPKPPVST